MSTQGAIQIDVTINNKSLTITKDHVMSLRVKRVIGDAANEFTLEAFDETAFALENALMQGRLAPISVRYSSAKDMNKSIIFSGTCLNYQMSFVGRASVITITGILSLSSGDSSGFWFGTQAIEWVGDIEDWASEEDRNNGIHDWHVDGKGWNEIINYENNEDVCAIYTFPTDENGNVMTNATPIVYYNPTRIFKRIIKKYNGDIGVIKKDTEIDDIESPDKPISITLADYGAGTFILGETDASRWIEGVRRCQESNETAAQYINNVLCKYAISDTGVSFENETAGFKYYIQNGKHCFTKLNYGEEVSKGNVVTVTYGMQDSNVISFSMSNIGATAMVGGVSADGTLVIDQSALDYLYTDEIDARGSTVLGVNNTTETTGNSNVDKYANWYFGLVKGVNVSSTLSKTGISAVITDTWKKLQDLTYTAELTIWADYSNRYVPGDYIDIVVMGAGGVRHYSSGTYMILSIDDNISSSGYTQSMKLLKNTTNTKSTTNNSGNSDIVLYNYDGEMSIHSASIAGNSNTVSAISALSDNAVSSGSGIIGAAARAVETVNNYKAYLDELAVINKKINEEKGQYMSEFMYWNQPANPDGTYSDAQYKVLEGNLNKIEAKYESEKIKLKTKYGV